MEKHKEILKEIVKGNGDQFTVKEMLQSKMRDDKDFHDYVREKFEKGGKKISKNFTRIKSLETIFWKIVFPSLGGLLAIIITLHVVS